MDKYITKFTSSVKSLYTETFPSLPIGVQRIIWILGIGIYIYTFLVLIKEASRFNDPVIIPMIIITILYFVIFAILLWIYDGFRKK